MALVTADGKAVQSDQVASCVTLTDVASDVWWVTVLLLSGQTVNFRFEDADKRDGFYKELITAMGA